MEFMDVVREDIPVKNLIVVKWKRKSYFVS